MGFLRLLEIVLTAPFGDVYYLMLTKSRHSKKKIAGIMLLFCTITILLNIALTYAPEVIPGFLLPKYIERTLFVFSGWIFSIAISEHKGYRNLFSFLTACTFYEIQDLFATIFILTSQNKYPYAKLLCKMLAFLIIVEVLYRFVRKPFLDILSQEDLDWKRFCLIPMMLTVSFFLLGSYPLPLSERPQNIPAALSLCLAIILFDMMQYVLFRQMQINFQAVKNVADIKIQVMALQKQMKRTTEAEKKLIIFQHDLRHFTNSISACLANKEYEEAEALLSSMNRTIGRIRPAEVVYCENRIMNAVISMFVHSAEEEGIEVSVKTGFPENSGINYEELSVVFANAMENAIHACQKIGEGKQKTIRVTCAPSGRQLLIEIANTYEGDTEFDKKTGFPRSRQEGHGIGTQSISSFAKRHNGILLYQAKDGWFCLRLILPISSKCPL